ncbi:bacteriodes thetaiotaomicron symbiotic chitinase [Aspergillus clavatus NRRL 1]|uniref:chitinase n=1 Tax=Aspergillus clavatus (strain ATCC 1007 / CBS 513.65 / DSM 816 / NCTC 3887 / NRRL 1 / QM 1276 / 107) TaxID=344612 RepID=A1C6S5_ASPCL|nr:bacteriodes thetaiotaomicron symbiotic chitinase [Aspergillus clavatus NRRL 1]EAW14096.1 bacteriodes thetaiotaomicron symbiotic chitinase [Aspergillus clavatus NRRL 1]
MRHSFISRCAFISCLLGSSFHAHAQSGTCSNTQPCTSGCCSNSGHCGFGPDFCGSDACVSTCDAVAECGEYAAVNGTRCPLNVCCSPYGFCGTTELFCGTGCQSGCEAVNKPSCSGTSSDAIYMGYYEGWNPTQRMCDILLPQDINVTPWTHLYYAFAGIDSTDSTITTTNPNDEEYWRQFTALKQKKPSLKTYISVGGWDLGGKVFSDMVKFPGTRQSFITSAIAMMKQYGFDGIDIDWEYPAAEDRGGVEGDTANLVKFLAEMRDAIGNDFGLTATLPSSYWYMKGFDIVSMAKYVDYFNFMAYDIHGTWDGTTSNSSSPDVNPHTNLTEISAGLDLLWRNSIDPSKVLLGLGFYGRSFTLADPSCNTPGCPFYTKNNSTGGGVAGECTVTSGILSDYEINRILEQYNVNVEYDATAGVNWMTWNSNQWVSYDNARTLRQKADFANGKCLAGLFSWAVDLGGPGTLTNPNDLTASDFSMAGASTDGGDDGSGIVYVGQDIFGPSPTVSAIAPVSLIFPPFVLPTPTVITPDPYPTSLEVAWPTVLPVVTSGTTTYTTTITRTIVNTTLEVSPITTTALHFWGWNLTNGVNSTSGPLIISLDIPDTTIEIGPVPGVTRTPTPRVVKIPPWPWVTTTGGIEPTVHFIQGNPPSPTCTANCGHKCYSFCDGPCLVDCGSDSGSSSGFLDPEDSDPPSVGKCVGPDCKNGKCTGTLCVQKGCTGDDCESGICLGSHCTPTGCTGSDCDDGHCAGSHCQDHGCVGSECNSGSGTCWGLSCLSWGCIGLDCSGSSFTCSGPLCHVVSCSGPKCSEGICTGSGCQSEDGDCQSSEADVCTEWITSTLVTPASTYSTSTITSHCSTITACSAQATTSTSTVGSSGLVEGTVSDVYFSPTANSNLAASADAYWSTFWSQFEGASPTTISPTTTPPTTTSPTTTTTAPSTTNIPNSFMIFKYEVHTVYFDTSETYSYSWYGDYYSYMQDVTSDNVCTNSYKVIGPVDANAGDPFPASLRSFNLPAQYTGCTYSGSTDSVGSVSCGSNQFSCSKIDGYDGKTPTYDCGKTTADGGSTYIYHYYFEAIQCSITY